MTHLLDSISDMASSDTQDWQLVRHPGILEKIMLMIGLESLESDDSFESLDSRRLDICRQVCKAWNAIIMNKIWENPTKKWGMIIQRRIERSWDIMNNIRYYYPSDKQISRVKSLGKYKVQALSVPIHCC